MKTKKQKGPIVIVGYRLEDAGVIEMIRVDNLRTTDGETSAQAAARTTRTEWARKALRQWSPTSAVARVMSDGTETFVDYAEARGALEHPNAVPIASMVPTVAPTVEKTPRKRDRSDGRKISNHSAACGCDVCTEARDVARGIVVKGVQASAEVTALVPIAASVVTAEETVKASAEPLARIFTVGYDGGLSLDTVRGFVIEYGIGRIVDTRQSTIARKNPGFSGKLMSKVLGDLYIHAPSEREVTNEIERHTARGVGVLLLRREEAPGDNAFHLEIAKRFKVAHIHRDELIGGEELQAALDADARMPDIDHEYECFVDVKQREEVQASAAA